VKDWNEYPAQFREAVIEAHAKGAHRVIFEAARPAYSFRTRVWRMQDDIATQADAPVKLRDACVLVRWIGPVEEAGMWVLTGTTAGRPGMTDDDVIAAIR